MLIESNIYEEVLFDPLRETELNRLLIVSGYATSAMSFRHLNDLKKKEKDISIELIVGMTQKEGISKSNHEGFKSIMSVDFSDNFKCSYIYNGRPVHSKIYVWCLNSAPKIAFTGSANYTQNAFISNSQREVLSYCNSDEAIKYFNSLIKESIYCNNEEAEQLITIYREKQREELEEATNIDADYVGLKKVTVSFLDGQGRLPLKSGLNWGQREGREHNQAYIRVPAEISDINFFPPRKSHFTVLTDDGKTLICVTAQDRSKGIHTPHNNSLIGEYFRNRLGVPNGGLVTKNHLTSYGRTDVAFYKIDDETYYMDFSV